VRSSAFGPILLSDFIEVSVKQPAAVRITGLSDFVHVLVV
jgi:hypothetical protein